MYKHITMNPTYMCNYKEPIKNNAERQHGGGTGSWSILVIGMAQGLGPSVHLSSADLALWPMTFQVTLLSYNVMVFKVMFVQIVPWDSQSHCPR